MGCCSQRHPAQRMPPSCPSSATEVVLSSEIHESPSHLLSLGIFGDVSLRVEGPGENPMSRTSVSPPTLWLKHSGPLLQISGKNSAFSQRGASGTAAVGAILVGAFPLKYPVVGGEFIHSEYGQEKKEGPSQDLSPPYVPEAQGRPEHTGRHFLPRIHLEVQLGCGKPEAT